MQKHRPTLEPGASRAIAALVLLTVALALAGCATTHEGPPLDRTIEHRWTDDIEVMFDTLPRKHKNLFFKLPEAEYRRRLSQLNRRAADLSAPEFEIALRRILADVGDAHTNIGFPYERLFPLQFHSFEEGMYVTAVVAGYEEYLGARLEQVEETAVADFREAAAEITPHDNDSQLAMMTPYYLMMPSVLAGLGISYSESEVTYTLVRPGESTPEEVSFPAIERESVTRLVSLRERLAEQGVTLPVSRRASEALYRHEYLPDHDAVYVQYNSCREDDSYPMRNFAEDVFETVRREEAQILVVDLRSNSGGDSRVLRPLIDGAVEWRRACESTAERPSEDRELYVLIGRNTFSSAVLNAIDLKQDAGAVFVGEPSGGRPDHYGEIKSLELPNLGRRLTYSTKYFDHYEAGDPPALMPDIEAPVSYEAYIEGRDLALEAALGS